MEKAAAIRGTFADFRLIKSRKVAQLVIELPIEEADAALVTLGGLPQPASERWVALAALNVTSIKPKEKRRFDDLKSAMQAGIKCTEPVFWRFIQENYKASAYDEEGAAKFVRRYCGVKSRSELNLDPSAAEAWERLAEQFEIWMREPQHA